MSNENQTAGKTAREMFDDKVLGLYPKIGYTLTTGHVEKILETMNQYASQQVSIATEGLKAENERLRKKLDELGERILPDGWQQCKPNFTPYTGIYQVMDSDGNTFRAVWDDIEKTWDTDKYILYYRDFPEVPGKGEK